MDRYELELELESLRTELRLIAVLDEKTVCEKYNVDCKEDAIECYEDEIAFCKKQLEAILPDDDGMDYKNLQLSQGMAVINW